MPSEGSQEESDRNQQSSTYVPDELVVIEHADEIVVINSEFPFEEFPGMESLNTAVEQEKPVIAIKNKHLARDVALWFRFGKMFRKISVFTAFASMVMSATSIFRLSKAFGMFSVIFGSSYCAIWHYDKLYRNYHVADSVALLAILGRGYRRGSHILLVKNFKTEPFVLPVASSMLSFFVAFANSHFTEPPKC